MTNVQANIVQILRDYAVVDGATVRLTCGQLDRKTYLAVNEVLERLGGKWKGGKVKAHIFADDPVLLLDEVIQTGAMPKKNPLAYFATPASIATRMVDLANLDARSQVLEPSAGEGAICDAVREAFPSIGIRTVEIDPRRAARLRAKGYEVYEQDFLSFHPPFNFNRVLMNPPFAVEGNPLVYIEHIKRAWDMLDAGGRLVAIASGGITFRTDKRSTAFRQLVQRHGDWEELADGAFNVSGTGVTTVILHLTRPAQVHSDR